MKKTMNTDNTMLWFDAWGAPVRSVDVRLSRHDTNIKGSLVEMLSVILASVKGKTARAGTYAGCAAYAEAA